jgi:leucyl/phenylalanyl-tRNA---protein transferase
LIQYKTMPIFQLGKELVFPPPELASSEGIIAVGGDLSSQRLINAYTAGIFPWFSEDDPIIWWSPDPRLVLLPGNIHVSGSMKRLLKRNPFRLTCDRQFLDVLEHCRKPRPHQDGTWITDEIRDAYLHLHHQGIAHSVEVWAGDRLAGGLYGISLGKCFFGESMFSDLPNASKFAFITFSEKLFRMGFAMVDCQVPSDHLKRLGATEIPRSDFLARLKEGLKHKTIVGKWNLFDETATPNI